MKRRIAKFEKVSPTRFAADMGLFATENEMEFFNGVDAYNSIQLPKRSTSGSAGYDFYAPFEFTLKPGETIKIYTGIRCWIDDGWALFALPRSGMSNRTKVRLDNTVGLIDSDYYYADNEGHIMIQMTTVEELHVKKGERFCQGVFLPYGITTDDNAQGIRTGGFGSTGRA